MDTDAQVKRIAALWCREFDNAVPSSSPFVTRWVKQNYGPVLDKEKIDYITRRLGDEIKQQIRLRMRRKKNRPEELGPRTRDQRVAAVLQSVLGPARLWVSKHRLSGLHTEECQYIGGAVLSGLTAGIIPVTMRLRRITDPNLLVYREKDCEPKSYWIPGSVTDVAAALVWLIPPEVQEFLSLEGVRVKHDGEEQAVRLTTPYGEKLIPWRGLRSSEI